MTLNLSIKTLQQTLFATLPFLVFKNKEKIILRIFKNVKKMSKSQIADLFC